MTCRQHRNLGTAGASEPDVKGPPPRQEPREGLWDVMWPAVRLTLILLAIILVIGAFLLLFSPARAHMHDRPDLDEWFNGLKSDGGYPCCSQVDGSTVSDVDWDTTVVAGKLHYRVRVEGMWIVVTDEEVVKQPNRYGTALVWVYHVDTKPMVRCFMPGAGG